MENFTLLQIIAMIAPLAFAASFFTMVVPIIFFDARPWRAEKREKTCDVCGEVTDEDGAHPGGYWCAQVRDITG